MRKALVGLSGILILLTAALSGSASSLAAGRGSHLRSVIAFSSTRDNPTFTPAINAAEIYLMNGDGTEPRRLTDNTDGDGFATLSPDGKRIVFDSNRNRGVGESLFTSDLYLMKADGREQTLLTRGSSASWSPDGKRIAFHASATGTGTPIRTDPGSATTDSDIFVARIEDAAIESLTNLTGDGAGAIDDDPDWSPDGQSIIYTSHQPGDDVPLGNGFVSNTADIYKVDADGTDAPTDLTPDNYEERAPAWSPDGARVAFSCRIGGDSADLEICVMNGDGTGLVQQTDNTVADITPTWSPDGQEIVFQRQVQGIQLFTMEPRSTATDPYPTPTKLTSPPGINLIPHWGVLWAPGQEPAP